VEPIERLAAQGEDTDKEIYTISRLGGDSDREPRLGLHFDQTVPFARYVLEHAGKLHFPFRRYQMQKVWRGERPQEGRYREFTQADIDVIDVGQLAPHFEAEMPLVIADVFARLPMPNFVIGVNNRKIPEGFYRGLGLPDITGTLRIVDKLDKIGPDAVTDLLRAAGASHEQAAACLALAEIRTPDTSFVDRVRGLGVSHPLLDEGLTALAEVVETVAASAPGTIVADLKIARGLDYYTGTVFETRLSGHVALGSICSGGRYDALATDGRTTYPGVGISLGVSRLLVPLFHKGALDADRSVPSVVLVALPDEAARADCDLIAQRLRANGVATEVAAAAQKFGKQIRYAERRGIPYVWFPGTEGPDEVKDIRSGAQAPADAETWVPPDEDLTPRVVSTQLDRHNEEQQ
jgi:histidyl-tRNA synthetase